MKAPEIAAILKTVPPGFFGGNLYDEKEIAAAARVIFNKSPFRFYGPRCTFETDQLEKECCEYFGVSHVHTTNSGCGALMAGLHALDVGPGDEVIMPGFFWVADSNTVLLRGAIPVLCEVDESLNMDPADLVKRITPRTKCVIAIHMTGAQADIQAICDICRKRNIKVLEDVSQCLGGSVGNRKLGAWGDVAMASLQLNKTITSGEGGLIFTNSRDYYMKATARTDLGYPRVGGISSNTGDDAWVTVGEGRRFTEIAAAIMREQLRKLPSMLGNLRTIKKGLKDRLRNKGAFTFRKIIDETGEAGTVLTLLFNTDKDRACFMDASRKLFPGNEMRLTALRDMGLHIYHNCSNLVKKLPALPGGFPWNLPQNAGSYTYDRGTLPGTDAIIDRGVMINLPPDMTALQQEALGAGMEEVLRIAD